MVVREEKLFAAGSPVAAYWLSRCEGFEVRAGRRSVGTVDAVVCTEPAGRAESLVVQGRRRPDAVAAERVVGVVPARRLVLLAEPVGPDRTAALRVALAALSRAALLAVAAGARTALLAAAVGARTTLAAGRRHAPVVAAALRRAATVLGAAALALAILVARLLAAAWRTLVPLLAALVRRGVALAARRRRRPPRAALRFDRAGGSRN
jgi:hypothetical protein